MAVAGGYFKDRLWVIQSFWSIFYRKIMWYHLNFAIVTLVIYGHRLMLKTQLRTMEESESIYRETTINQLTSIEGGVLKQEDRMMNLETLLQTWTNRNPTRQYNEVAAGLSDWWTIPDQQPKRSRTETVIP